MTTRTWSAEWQLTRRARAETRSWTGFAIARIVSIALSLVGPLTGQATERVSVDSSGAQGDAGSGRPSLSADGRYVAFASDATALVAGDTNGRTDVFVRDRQSGVTERVSVDSAGAQGNGPSGDPSISADGRYVAFHSDATDLVVGDTNGRTDVFVHDRETGVTERVSVDSSGVQGNGSCFEPSLAEHGRLVAFWGRADNLVPGDTNAQPDVFVHDRETGATERVSVGSSGAQGNDASTLTEISADGRYVAFASEAGNLVNGDTNGKIDVFLYDRENGTTERVSVDSNGVQGNDTSYWPSVSAHGRYVAFASLASNFVNGDTSGAWDVYVRDRWSRITDHVSDSGGMQPSISADGDLVAFRGPSANVFVHDPRYGTTALVSIDPIGAEANLPCEDPAISADGRCVVFSSTATNLVSGDTNGAADVFVSARCVVPTSTAYFGDGINVDAIEPLSVVLGSTWSAPLTLAHSHGTGGPLSLKVRSVAVNGPNFLSPIGGRLTEVLIGGPLLAVLPGTHDGSTGDIAPRPIPPDEVSLVGLSWAAQYAVVGGGFGDYSQAVSGVIGCE